MSRKKAIRKTSKSKGDSVLKRGVNRITMAAVVIGAIGKYGPKVADTVRKIKEG